MRSIEAKVERLLSEVERPRPLSERCAFAIAHQRELIECIRDLLRYIAGTHAATSTLTVKATRLVAAVSPLLTRPAGVPHGFVDEWREGTAPDLRAAVEDLKSYLENPP